ncbi:hypothetical protein SAMN05216551_12020 [Chitinasiproducens palmae]|uniref:Uncharacterized protein n=1 Tax=Chitinasiproducens palmae TaxID=1770053 RepID=A0A1H2PWB5_9BURK|nr:hypothetical protein SAMN05216551_12020 [Chitinasiproducens palmae]
MIVGSEIGDGAMRGGPPDAIHDARRSTRWQAPRPAGPLRPEGPAGQAARSRRAAARASGCNGPADRARAWARALVTSQRVGKDHRAILTHCKARAACGGPRRTGRPMPNPCRMRPSGPDDRRISQTGAQPRRIEVDAEVAADLADRVTDEAR